MAYVTKKSTVLYVTQEVTEGVAVNPTAGNQAVSILADGFELNPEKELVERNNLTNSIAKALPRTGIKSASGSVGVELKASSVAGAAPEADLLFLAALGAVRSLTSTVTINAVSTNTTVINIPDATKFAVGDTVMIKSTSVGTDGYHLSPITTVTEGGTNQDTITLLVPTSTNFAQASDTIEKFTTFYGVNDGHPSLTLTSLMDTYETQASGCRVSSLSIDSFETGQIASFSFGLTGQNYQETPGSSGPAVAFDGGTPPLILGACLFKDGVQLPVNSVAVSVENTLAPVQNMCSENGIIAQRITERTITGSLVPYMDSTSSALFDSFDENTQFSLFFYAKVPGASAGIKKEVVAVYLPNCICTALPKQDADGLMQYSLEFSAGPSSSGVGSDIYISFI
jgi:hypothetical protein